MIHLATLLLRQRIRRLERQYGWQLAASLALVLLLVLWKAARIVSNLVALGTVTTLDKAFAWCWVSWVLMGVLTGRDLTWHVRLDRLFVFRAPFRNIYLLDVALAFLSYPLLICALGISYHAVRNRWTVAQWLWAQVAFAFLVLITRAVVSLVRTIFYRSRGMRFAIRLPLLIVAAAFVVLLFAPAVSDSFAQWNPGRALAAAFQPGRGAAAAMTLGAAALVLLALDYALQSFVQRSGALRATTIPMLARFNESLLLAGPSTPSMLWRVTMLGWLRNRNALLLLIWGTLYGFFYPWLTRTAGLGFFLSFAWMVLIFHSYLRGNLFGVDQKGVWFFFLLPVSLRDVIRAKSSSIAALQCIMIAAVLLPAVLRTTSGMVTAFAWVCVLGFCASALAASDIAGQLFSVLHPDPIERGSLYAGGLTLGAVVIPIVQVVLLVLYLVVAALVERSLPAAAAMAFFAGLPLFLLLIRWRALPIWIDRLLARDREEILTQLAAVTP